LKHEPHVRSSLNVLRELTSSDLVLELDPRTPVARFDEASLTQLGALVAGAFSGVPAAERIGRLEELARDQARRLGGVARSLTAAERRGARLLSPLIALIDGATRRWPAAERRALWDLVRAKGAVQERGFVQLARRHAAFWRALGVAASRG
jgi:hypothetical protein